MPKVNWNALKTNENGARTKALIAAGVTVAVIAAGVYLTKKTASVPVMLVVEDASEAIVDTSK